MNLDSTLALGGGMGFSQDTGRQGWKMKKEKPQVVSKTFFFFFEKCFLLIFPVVSQRPYTFYLTRKHMTSPAVSGTDKRATQLMVSTKSFYSLEYRSK